MPRDLPLANNASIPELDVVQIPHEIRHGAMIIMACPISRVLNAP